MKKIKYKIFSSFLWLRLKSAGFQFQKYKKVFLLRKDGKFFKDIRARKFLFWKYKNSFLLGEFKDFFNICDRKFHFWKYKNSFLWGEYKESFLWRKYKDLLIFELIPGNIRNFFCVVFFRFFGFEMESETGSPIIYYWKFRLVGITDKYTEFGFYFAFSNFHLSWLTTATMFLLKCYPCVVLLPVLFSKSSNHILHNHKHQTYSIKNKLILEQWNQYISVLQETGHIKNRIALIFRHIRWLHLVHSEVAWELVSSETQVQPQTILVPDYYLSVSCDYEITVYHLNAIFSCKYFCK